MLRISKLADYSMLILTRMCEAPGTLHPAQHLAELCQLEVPTVSKILKILQRNGIIDSVRGAHGGYRLTRQSDAIKVSEVIQAIEGPFGLTECSVAPGVCSLEHNCRLRGNWQVIDREVHKVLDQITLADMRQPLQAKRFAPRLTRIKKPVTAAEMIQP